MSELETCNFSLPADLSAPLGRHAIDMARLEVMRLLLVHEFPSMLEISFQKTGTQEPHNNKQLYMPAELEPHFTCVRTPEETYELTALLPFSLKTKQLIGACSIGLTMVFPNRDRSMMGRPELHWLARIFAPDESNIKHPVRPIQKTPAATLRDFSDSVNSLRKGVPVSGYTYDWVSMPPPSYT